MTTHATKNVEPGPSDETLTDAFVGHQVRLTDDAMDFISVKFCPSILDSPLKRRRGLNPEIWSAKRGNIALKCS